MSDLPNIKVVDDNGHQERMDPRIMSFLIQDDQLVELTNMRKLADSKVPAATTSPVFYIENHADVGIDPPWISFSMINDGPGAVFIEVNERQTSLQYQDPIPVGGKLDVDFGHAVITRLLFQCASNLPASIRCKAIVGKRPPSNEIEAGKLTP